MKIFFVLFALAGISLANQEFYKTGNDNLDVENVAKDPVAVKRYLDCFLDKGPCDALALSYKVLIHDSLLTACLKCNDAQKYLWNRFLYHLKTEHPKEYEEFQRKYDPTKALIAALDKILAKIKRP